MFRIIFLIYVTKFNLILNKWEYVLTVLGQFAMKV